MFAQILSIVFLGAALILGSLAAATFVIGDGTATSPAIWFYLPALICIVVGSALLAIGVHQDRTGDA